MIFDIERIVIMSSFVCLCDDQKVQALGLGLVERVSLSIDGVSINTRITVYSDSEQGQVKYTSQRISEMFSRNITALHSIIEKSLDDYSDRDSKLVPLDSIYKGELDGIRLYIIFKTIINIRKERGSIKSSGFIEICDRLRGFEQAALKYV